MSNTKREWQRRESGRLTFWGLVSVVLVGWMSCQGSLASAQDADLPAAGQVPLMRGQAKNREMLLKGRVLNSDGKPASEYDLSVRLRTQFDRRVLPVTLQGSEFKAWVPIGGSGWFFVSCDANSNDGRSRKHHVINSQSLRQSAVDGIELKLVNADRKVNVSVVHNGQPVPDAHVVGRLHTGVVLQGITGSDGALDLHLGDQEKLNQLTAWTDDFRIGGFLFSRKPRRDPLGSGFTIELNNCRDQKVRLLKSDDELPIADVAFDLTLGTGKPDYNFVAGPETFAGCRLTTDENGEAVCRWFPDWERHGAYVNIVDSHWAQAERTNDMEADVDGVLSVKLKPRVSRKPLFGKVSSDRLSVGGLMVQVRSFQGEEDGRSDHLTAFTDEDGNFTADCIPGATYCVCVNDPMLTSDTIDLIPYESDTGKSNVAELKVSEGETIQIRVTQGPDHQPMRKQFVSLRAKHDFSWWEDGEGRHGSGGRSWSVTTNDEGIAFARALAGTELEAAIYAGEWRSGDKTVTVKPDEVTTIDFHRPLTSARKVQGRLLAPEGVDVANAQIVYGSIGGETDEVQSITADKSGGFAFTTRAIQLGIFAYTTDNNAAAVVRPKDVSGFMEIYLKRTGDLHGQLLGENDEPLADHPVRVRLRVRGKRDFSKSFSTSFAAKDFETRTSDDGTYTLRGLPRDVDMTLSTDSIDNPADESRLDEFVLTNREEHPSIVSRLARSRLPDARSMAERYDSSLRDAALGDFGLLAIIYDSTSANFVGRNVTDYEKTAEVMSFLNLRITEKEMAVDATRQFVVDKGWPQPESGQVFLVALDATGQELGRVELNPSADGVQSQASDFIRDHAPPQSDAVAKWDAAIAEARRSGRKVWARVSQRYCGPCFGLSRWLDDNRELLEKDYVLLKIDDARDENGVEIAKRIVSDRDGFGVPFHAIFDADEKLLIDSEGPTGNIGNPSGYEGRTHLMEMLLETRRNLSPEQVGQIVETLE